MVKEVLDLYRGGGETRIRLASELSPVMCRADELKEVLLNLIENSRAAMPEGGSVRISAEDGNDPGSWTTILVEDEGAGISPALLPRIFEPKFSTRSTGTGLGLAIVATGGVVGGVRRGGERGGEGHASSHPTAQGVRPWL